MVSLRSTKKSLLIILVVLSALSLRRVFSNECSPSSVNECVPKDIPSREYTASRTEEAGREMLESKDDSDSESINKDLVPTAVIGTLSEQGLTFDEWRQLVLHNESFSLKDLRSYYRQRYVGITENRVNFASAECGARVLLANKEAKSAKNVLAGNKDEYLLSPCNTPDKFLVIELCEEILVDTLLLANYELFSSVFRNFSLFASDTHPASNWTFLGNWSAENCRTDQVFTVSDPKMWTKYLRFEFHSHYGKEFYCPISTLKVFGTSMLEEFKASVSPVESIEENVSPKEQIHVDATPSSTVPIVEDPDRPSGGPVEQPDQVPTPEEKPEPPRREDLTFPPLAQSGHLKMLADRLVALEINSTLSRRFADEQAAAFRKAIESMRMILETEISGLKLMHRESEKRIRQQNAIDVATADKVATLEKTVQSLKSKVNRTALLEFSQLLVMFIIGALIGPRVAQSTFVSYFLDYLKSIACRFNKSPLLFYFGLRRRKHRTSSRIVSHDSIAKAESHSDLSYGQRSSSSNYSPPSSNSRSSSLRPLRRRTSFDGIDSAAATPKLRTHAEASSSSSIGHRRRRSEDFRQENVLLEERVD